MDGFPGRIYLTTTVVAVVVALWLWSDVGAAAALAFLAGVALGLLNLSLLVLVVRRAGPEPPQGRRTVPGHGVVQAAKLAIAAAVFYVFYRWARDQLPLVGVGYGVPIAVMMLKGLGRRLNERAGVG